MRKHGCLYYLCVRPFIMLYKFFKYFILAIIWPFKLLYKIINSILYKQEVHNTTLPPSNYAPEHMDLYYVQLFNKTIADCKKANLDYVFCSAHPCCAECAKFQARVYCLSGKDKRFPKLPDIVWQLGNFHPDCRHTFYPFYADICDQITDSRGNHHNAIRYSNRPFVDDRTPEDKTIYQEYVDKKEREARVNENKELYYLLKSTLPEHAPKSVSAFSRMRNSNTASYQQLKELARQHGIDI